MSEHTEASQELAERVEAAKGFLDVDGKRARAAELEAQAADPGAVGRPGARPGDDVAARHG